jgi:hypothetical protein
MKGDPARSVGTRDREIMSTTFLTSAERFDAEYPEDLGDRLAWLERRLRVSRGRILRVMGVADADGRSWKEIAHAHEAQAERAEHLLTHYLAYFDYDAERAGDFVRDFGRKVEQGDIRISDHVPGVAAAATPEAEDEALLCSLHDEGMSLLPALARLLADRPATADRTTPRPSA